MVFDDVGCRAAATRRPTRATHTGAACVLTAGLGTPLRPLTCVRAKAGGAGQRRAAGPAAPSAGWSRTASPISCSTCITIPAIDRRRRRRRRAISARASAIRGNSRCSGSAGGPRHALPLLRRTRRRRAVRCIVNGDTLTRRRPGRDARRRIARIRRARDDGADPESPARQVRRRAASTTRLGHRVHPAPARRARAFTSSACRSAQARAFAALEDGVPAESVMRPLPAADCRERRALVRGFVVRRAVPRHRHAGGLPADVAASSRPSKAIGWSARATFGRSRRRGSTRTVVWDDVTIGAARARASASSATAYASRTARAIERRALVRRRRSAASSGDERSRADCCCDLSERGRMRTFETMDMTEKRSPDSTSRASASTAIWTAAASRARQAAGRAADRRRVGPPLFPRPAARTRRRSCWRCMPAPFDFDDAAVRQRRAAARRRCRCRSRDPRARRRPRRARARRISATSRCRRTSAPPRRRSTPRSTARRSR